MCLNTSSSLYRVFYPATNSERTKSLVDGLMTQTVWQCCYFQCKWISSFQSFFFSERQVARQETEKTKKPLWGPYIISLTLNFIVLLVLLLDYNPLMDFVLYFYQLIQLFPVLWASGYWDIVYAYWVIQTNLTWVDHKHRREGQETRAFIMCVEQILEYHGCWRNILNILVFISRDSF